MQDLIIEAAERRLDYYRDGSAQARRDVLEGPMRDDLCKLLESGRLDLVERSVALVDDPVFVSSSLFVERLFIESVSKSRPDGLSIALRLAPAHPLLTGESMATDTYSLALYSLSLARTSRRGPACTEVAMALVAASAVFHSSLPDVLAPIEHEAFDDCAYWESPSDMSALLDDARQRGLVDVHGCASDGAPWLERALARGNAEAMAYLVSRGASIQDAGDLLARARSVLEGTFGIGVIEHRLSGLAEALMRRRLQEPAPTSSPRLRAAPL